MAFQRPGTVMTPVGEVALWVTERKCAVYHPGDILLLLKSKGSKRHVKYMFLDCNGQRVVGTFSAAMFTIVSECDIEG